MADGVITPSGANPGFATRLRRGWALHPERNLQILIAIVATLLFASPLVAVLIGAFRTTPYMEGPDTGVWSLAPITEVFTSAQTWITLGNTLLLAAATVIPGVIIATFFATIITRTNAWAKWLITGTMAILVAVPPMFYAMTWSMLANKTTGLLNVLIRGIGVGFDDQNMSFSGGTSNYLYANGPFDINSWGGLITVTLFRTVGFMFLLLIGPFSQMDRTLEEAARVSGASPLRTFFGTQLTTLAPAIAAVFIGATVASFEAFDVPVLIGVPANIYVLPTRVYSYLNDGRHPLFGHAMAISIILLVILLLLLIAERRVIGRRRFTTVSGKGARQTEWRLGPWQVPVFIITLVFVIVAVLGPFLQLLQTAFSPYVGWNAWDKVFDPQAGLTIKNFQTLICGPSFATSCDLSGLQPYLTTATNAGIAAFVGIVIVTIILWAARLLRGWLATYLGWVQLLPMTIPGLLLALGIITVVLASPARGLYGAPIMLIIALIIAVVPLGNRSIAGAIAQIPAELEEATRVSGGTRGRALVGVIFRLLVPSLLNGWLLTFIVASGTLAIPMLLGDQKSPMLAIRVYSDVVTNANFTRVAAEFMLFIVEILVLTVIINLINWALRRATSTSRKALAIVPTTDPEWTGAVATKKK